MGRESPAVYALEGSVAIAGAAIRFEGNFFLLFLIQNGFFFISWLKDNMNLFDSIKDIDRVTHSVDNCGDVYFVPAFSGLYAPYWNQEARG